jgi:hypothetical protein
MRRSPFDFAPNTTPSTRLDGGIMSRTIKFAKFGRPEVVEMKLLAPGQHEVRIEVKAIGSTVPNQCGAMIDMSNP